MPLTRKSRISRKAQLTRKAVGVLAMSAAATGIGLTFASSAVALEPETKAQDARRRADVLLKEGIDLESAGKSEAALAKLEEAYALLPSGTAIYHVARAEQALGRHALALEHYREALRDGALPAPARRDAETAIEDLKTKIGMITLDVPPGVTTTVDGNVVDVKTAVEVVPGKHVVKIRLSDEVKSVDVAAAAGVVTPVVIRFGEEAPPSGTARGTSTAAAGEAPRPVDREPAAPWPLARIVTVGGLAAGAVGAGVLAIVFHANAQSSVDESKDLLKGTSCLGVTSAECARAAELMKDRDGSMTASTVSLVVAGVLAAGAVTGALFWPKAGRGRDAGAARFVPVVLPGYGGMSLMARY